MGFNVLTFWDQHGTKILGSVLSLFATTQAVLGAISAMPAFSLLVTPKQFATLSVVNVALGVLTFKRGFTNSRNNPPSDSSPQGSP